MYMANGNVQKMITEPLSAESNNLCAIEKMYVPF